MSTHYVDVASGNDTTGNGTSASPYKTISFVLSEYGSGTEIIVEVPATEEKTYCSEDESTLIIEDMNDITIRFYTSGDDVKYTSLVWAPHNIDPDKKATVYIKNSNNIKIEGATFAQTRNEDDNDHHIYAVKAENSTNVKLTNCRIDPDGWNAGSGSLETDIPEGALFDFSDCANATLSYLHVNRFNNPYNIPYNVIALSGPCEYTLNNTILKNVTTNDKKMCGLYVRPGTRKVTVNSFLAHNFIGDTIGNSIGIEIDGTDSISSTEFEISNGQFSNCHVGIKLTKVLYSTVYKRMIKHCTFFKCLTGIYAEGTYADLYSLSIYGGSTTVKKTNNYGLPTNVNTIGVRANSSSILHCINTIVTYCYYGFQAEINSSITLEHIVWNACEALRHEMNGGTVTALQFIRKTDPKYENLTADPWGYFMIESSSPCMDVGKDYGEEYLGNGPDIGAMERSSSTIQDLTAYVSRMSRYTDYIPMTEIDVEGMITKGLMTVDSQIMAGREGSALKDIAVKPLTGMLASFVTELEHIRSNLSFLNFRELDADAADALAANVFVSRDSGARASGVVRLYFDTPVAANIPAELAFATADGYMFYSTTAVAITEEEMTLNYDNGLYYMDILVEADMEGSAYNVSAGEITTCYMNLPANVVSVSNPYDFTNGANIETNSELYSKVKDAITTRDLVTDKGIRFVLREQFSDVRALQIIGYGDPEMVRDTILDDSVHIGGKVDIYMRLQSDTEDYHIFDPIYKENELSPQTFPKLPILRVSKLEILDPGTMDITGLEIPANKWELKVVSVKTRLSVYEKLVLKVDPMYEGYTVKMTFSWAEGLKSIQTWLLENEHRVVCADLHAKHFYPVFISFALYYHGESEIPGLADSLRNYILERTSSDLLQASDIIDYAYTLGSLHIVTPFTIAAETHFPDGSIKYYNNEDEVGIERIQCYMPGDITCTYLGVETD